MVEPKVVLKNVKMFQGHDGTGLNADVWINGINCMHVFDGAYGGEFEYTENLYNNPKAEQVKKNIALLNEYVNQLPEFDHDFNGRKTKLKMDLDMYIDEILVKQENEKKMKKFEKQKLKRMETCILIGKPDEVKYEFFDVKRPLSELPKDKFQTQLNRLVLTHCKNGVQVLNTNLEQLGVEVRY